MQLKLSKFIHSSLFKSFKAIHLNQVNQVYNA